MPALIASCWSRPGCCWPPSPSRWCSGTGLVAKSSADYFNELPDELSAPVLGRDTRLLNADGSVLAVLHDPENRVPVTIAQIPQSMQTAIIDIEDSRFYSTTASTRKGLARAALRNSEAGGVQEGGSTITQQYVKNVLLNQAATAAERAGRARVRPSAASSARRGWPWPSRSSCRSRQILEGYLNLAYFGNGAYGIGAAAKRYFGMPVERLNVAQSALLAGLVRSPTQYDPLKQPGGREEPPQPGARPHAAARAPHAAAGAVRPGNTDLGLAPVPPPAQGDACVTSIAPFFCDYVRNQPRQRPGAGHDPGGPGAAAQRRRPDDPDHARPERPAARPRTRSRTRASRPTTRSPSATS